MATFTLVSAQATTTNTTTIGASTAPGRFQIRTVGVKATAKVKAKLVQNERLYLGFIQTCISNDQVSDFYRLGAANAVGPVPFEPVVTVPAPTQKGCEVWTLSPLPCSDAAKSGTRPWYGTASSMDIRRINLHQVGEHTHELTMTDWFAPRPPHALTHPANSALYHLARWKRKQKFSTWLAVVFESFEKNGPLNYFPLWRFDWEYDGTIDQAWNSVGGNVVPGHATITDNIIINNDQRQQGLVTMTKSLQNVITKVPNASTASAVPNEAFTAPIANDVQSSSTTFMNR
jgi:hypothetical protein